MRSYHQPKRWWYFYAPNWHKNTGKESYAMEEKRVFLVMSEDEITGIQPPEGIYFTKFLSAAQELWVTEKMLKQKDNPYMMTGRIMHIPVYLCRLEQGVPTIRPKRERTKEMAYEL